MLRESGTDRASDSIRVYGATRAASMGDEAGEFARGVSEAGNWFDAPQRSFRRGSLRANRDRCGTCKRRTSARRLTTEPPLEDLHAFRVFLHPRSDRFNAIAELHHR